MRPFFRNNLRLRPSLLTAFVVLTVPVFVAIIAVTYISNDRIARENAQALIERFRVDAIEDIEKDINPIKSLVRAAATLGGELPDYYSTDRSITYFRSLLPHSDKIVSAYVGLADGSFRQARRIDSSVRVGNEFPPANAVFASRVIDPGKGTPLLDRYVFFVKAAQRLGALDEPTAYDPRTRGWYPAAGPSPRASSTSPTRTFSPSWALSVSPSPSHSTATAICWAWPRSTSPSTASASISLSARSAAAP